MIRVALLAALLSSVLAGGAVASSPPFRNWTLPREVRVADLVSRLTLEEKFSLMSSNNAAVPRLGVDAFNFGSECLHGVKVATKTGATVFPQPMALAATWDTDLVKRVFEAVGTEGRALANARLGNYNGSCWCPNMNLVRDVRWGRSAETYGEDPTLTSRMLQSVVTGLQGNDTRYLRVASTCKHYAGYSLEEADGDTRFAFNAVINELDWADTYAPAFQACVQDANVSAIMCSYNAVNSTPACSSPMLLQDTLREEWQFGGPVVSDCGAVGFSFTAHRFTNTLAEAAAKALLAGTDVNCGNGYDALNVSLAGGLITEADVDTALSRSLSLRFRLGEFDPPSMNPYASVPMSVVGSQAHMDLAVKAAQESVVLLKNEGGTLPLDAKSLTKVALIGPQAADVEVQLGNYHGNPYEGKVVTPHSAFVSRLGAAKVDYHQGCWVVGEGTWQFEDAVLAAEAADVAVLFLGSSSKGSNLTYPELLDIATEKESLDRRHIDLPGPQMDLVKAVAKRTTTPIVVVLVNGNALDISWAVESPRVGAIVSGWYPGQVGATGVADVLFGDVNPSGKLPVTWVYDNYTSLIAMGDMNMRAFPGRTHRFIQVPVLFPFGYGLSYTTFETTLQEIERAPGGVLDVHVSVANTGDVDGTEVVQLYTALVRPAGRFGDALKGTVVPHRDLRDFARVKVAAGATAEVTFSLDDSAFALAVPGSGLQLVHGVWNVMVGGETAAVDV